MLGMKKGVEWEILNLFVDKSNRPKKTPRHESAIQILLEKSYSSGQVKNALGKLEGSGHLTSQKYHIEKVGEAKFYYSKKLNEKFVQTQIPQKIKNIGYWISRYSNIKTTRMLGEHLHYLVKGELRAQDFEIIEEKFVRRYREKEWIRSKHTLDLIAENKRKNLTIAVEIKNMLTSTPKTEIITKLEMCKHLGVTPVFACRWMEGHRKEIEQSGGFLWQFKKQLYPFGQESLVAEIKKRFNLPVYISGELPKESVNEFHNWIINQ